MSHQTSEILVEQEEVLDSDVKAVEPWMSVAWSGVALPAGECLGRAAAHSSTRCFVCFHIRVVANLLLIPFIHRFV